MTDSIQGFILMGGASRRMGKDKAGLMLDGQTFVDRIARELLPVSSSVKLVGTVRGSEKAKARPKAELQTHDEFESVPDVYPAWGALGGVHAALAACTAPWAFVVACDFPFVTTELFERLASLREEAEAVAPVQHDEIPQPLCTLYRRSSCLDVATELIKSGERKPIALLQSVRTRWVSFSELSNLTDANHFFDNINTPEDYARLSSRLSVPTQR
jgi:molybdopterin-guanine dinucleotide biosynthesis protein A